jgi:aminoglycoside phosphotransferase
VIGLLDLVGRQLDERDRARYRFSPRMSFVLITPRFRASRHVVALLIPLGERSPSLVAKLARLPGDDVALAREATALRVLHAARPSVQAAPQVVAFARHPVPVLVETALAGAPLAPELVRTRLGDALAAARAWLFSLPGAPSAGDAFEELLATPLEEFEERFPAGSEPARLAELALEALHPLRRRALPRVFEHGDFCHPNILWSTRGLGAVDWELARPRGLPLHDHCLFLAYAAGALARAGSADEHVAAFRQAFFRRGWMREELHAFAEATAVPKDVIGPLVVACFARYTASIVDRADLRENGDWLPRNRYYALWREALWRYDDLGPR